MLTIAAAAQARKRRRVARVALAVAVLVSCFSVPAFAFHRDIIDFFSAAKASPVTVLRFERLDVLSNEDRTAEALGAGARRVATVSVGPERVALSIAPTRAGGFCALWSGRYGFDCVRSRPGTSGAFGTVSYGFDDSTGRADVVNGSTLRPDAQVQLLYADGARDTVPVIWVTAPIRAGFFLYRIPERHLGRTRPVALLAVVDGAVVEQHPILSHLSSGLVPRRDEWGYPIEVPEEGLWSRRRLLVSFNAVDNALLRLYVMPSRRGPLRTCWVLPRSVGCDARALRSSQLDLIVSSTGAHGSAFVEGRVPRATARLVLRYQDGAVSTVAVKKGFVLALIPERHWRLGHRLAQADAVDAAGATLAAKVIDARQRNVYPCAAPRNYGYGVRMCP